MIKYDNLAGNRYGRLLVDSEAKRYKGQIYYSCRCDCGNTKIIRANSLVRGATRSCGCLAKEKSNKPNYKGENPYIIVGDTVYVQLPNSKMEMLCDYEDWKNLRKFHWTKAKNGYAKTAFKENNKIVNRLFHVLVMGKEDGKVVDHINRNKLDNRKKNLRLVPYQINVINSGMLSTNTSGTKGVSWLACRNRWKAYIWVNNKEKYLGVYKTKDEAIKARKNAEAQYYAPLLAQQIG